MSDAEVDYEDAASMLDLQAHSPASSTLLASSTRSSDDQRCGEEDADILLDQVDFQVASLLQTSTCTADTAATATLVSNGSSSTSSTSSISSTSSTSTESSEIAKLNEDDVEALLDQVDITVSSTTREETADPPPADADSLLDQVDLDLLPLSPQASDEPHLLLADRAKSPDPVALLEEVELQLPVTAHQLADERANAVTPSVPEDLIDELVLPMESMSSASSSSSSSSSFAAAAAAAPSSLSALPSSGVPLQSDAHIPTATTARPSTLSKAGTNCSVEASSSPPAAVDATGAEQARRGGGAAIAPLPSNERSPRIQSEASFSSLPRETLEQRRVASQAHLHERYKMYDLDAPEEEVYSLPDRAVIDNRIAALFPGLRGR
jgi:hypothetical protein